MRRFLMERLRCPRCRAASPRPDTDTAELLFGPLRCPRCKASYPVDEGVADLVVDDAPPPVAQRSLEAPVVARAWERWLRPALVAATARRPLDRESEVVLYRSLLGTPDGPVLDVGCGTGFVLRRLARGGDLPALVGLDASRAMLEEAVAQVREAGVRVDFVRARVPSLPFQDASMGAVLQSGSLHLVEDAEGLFAEVSRVLRPGGRYVLATALPGPAQALQARLGVHLRSEEQLRAGLGGAGLTRVERLVLPPFLVLRAERPRESHVLHSCSTRAPRGDAARGGPVRLRAGEAGRRRPHAPSAGAKVQRRCAMVAPRAMSAPHRLPRLLPAAWPRWLYTAALLLGVAPLWASEALPMVDLPQHLHLISVLHRLDDPTTLYPQLFEARGTLTPYLGYYYLVSGLGWVLPLEAANRLFLSAYVAGFPLALAFLLRSLRRPAWPSLLALPFAYGDSFAWGFVNYCAALPLALLTCGLFVRTLEDAPRRRAWGAGLAVGLVAVLLFHVQAFAFLAVALPLLLLTTPVPEDGQPRDGAGGGLRARLVPRVPALVGVVPGVLLFLAWVVLRMGEPAEVEAGAPWKAWGPMLSPQNLAWKSFAQNRAELPLVLANMLRDGSDRWALGAVVGVALLALVAAALPRARGEVCEGPVARWRLLGLGGVALALYFLMPFDIRGYMYYLNTRFAHLAAPLLLAAVPVLRPPLQRLGVAAGALCALVLAVPLVQGFRAFDAEARAVREVAPAAGRAPRVMGLVYDTSSRVVRHPVFLHSAATVARELGGAVNFSFALTPHSPLKYRGTPPPTFPSEWRPDQFSWAAQGPAYDAFLLRGVSPGRVFGPLLGRELEVAAQAGNVWLVRRHGGTRLDDTVRSEGPVR